MYLKSNKCRLDRKALSDVEAPMPCRLAILRDPGTPDEIIVEDHCGQDLASYGLAGQKN